MTGVFCIHFAFNSLDDKWSRTESAANVFSAKIKRTAGALLGQAFYFPALFDVLRLMECQSCSIFCAGEAQEVTRAFP
jgi:hypothetical protein